MKKIAVFLSLMMLFGCVMGCAATQRNPEASVAATQRKLLDLCEDYQKHRYDDDYDEDEAYQEMSRLFVDKNSMDCPRKYVLEQISGKPEFELTANWGLTNFIYKDGSWKYVTMGDRQETADQVLIKLKHALKKCDADRFLSFLDDEVAQKYAGITGEKMCSDAQLNDLYASLAVLGKTHLLVSKKRTELSMPRWRIQLEYKDSGWKVTGIEGQM